MIYQFLLKMLTMEKNKILNFLHQNCVELAKVMDQNQVIHLIDVHTVEVMGELDPIKVSLLCNRPVLNVMEMVRKLLILVMIVMVKVKNKLLKEYL